MTKNRFEQLAIEALENLPSFFKEKLDNVDVVVEDWPENHIARGRPALPAGRLLLGLYQGVPKTKRGAGYTMALPDKITIFKGPIELVGRGNEESIKRIVIDTVAHEIAHHFGISDEKLRELKNKRD